VNVYDEEPDQVHDRLRRNADQDRRLMIPSYQNFDFYHSFGGLYMMSMKKNLIQSMAEIGRMRSRIGD